MKNEKGFSFFPQTADVLVFNIQAAQFREIASYDREKLGDFCDAQALVEEKEESLRKEMDTLTGLKKESEEV